MTIGWRRCASRERAAKPTARRGERGRGERLTVTRSRRSGVRDVIPRSARRLGSRRLGRYLFEVRHFAAVAGKSGQQVHRLDRPLDEPH